MEQRHTVHIVGGSSRSRAELARMAFELGHHAEIYSEVTELLDRPLREGAIIASGETLAEGVETLVDQLGEVGYGCRSSPPRTIPKWRRWSAR